MRGLLGEGAASGQRGSDTGREELSACDWAHGWMSPW
jgi:hypothetical protein